VTICFCPQQVYLVLKGHGFNRATILSTSF